MNTLQLEQTENLSGPECVLPELNTYYNAEPPSYRSFLAARKDHFGTRRPGILRGFLSVNAFGAHLNGKRTTPTPNTDAVRDAWFVVGRALYAAILEYRSSKQLSARPSENDPESTR
jgi:hypothetical protein